MNAETAAEPDRWIRNYRPGPAEALPLVHFPHAGGSASYYRPLCISLSDRFNALALQYPGRQDRRDEPCVTDLHVLADLLFDRLRHLADRPLAFFGHSMGALLAFEVTRRFERELGTSPVALFLSGRRAPSRRRDEYLDLSDDDSLLAEIRELSGTDPRLLGDGEMLRMILEPLRADYRALGDYHFTPAPPVRCPVTVLTGADDPRTSHDEAAAWQEHTTGTFALRTFPGGHFFLGENVTAVTDFVTERLTGAPLPG
ncbi:thioesterase II family protein [Streptomyces pacificus]|uniref:Thioesterase n=1 Tax=Streptomyces pacificus TaxID=2705029 RepID=A0A6A0AT83_9ACTN|nr:alpha/beta fold hydrolase [Streptomyces pacificus]GFH34807.1 thioesterase [Streptomyces pacificus]